MINFSFTEEQRAKLIQVLLQVSQIDFRVCN